jgi:H+/gluconate symporter-like permease
MTILGSDGRARIFKFTDYTPDPKPSPTPTPDNSDGFPVWAGILVGLLVGIIIGFVGAKLFSKLRGSKANKSQGDYERLTKERNDIIKDSLKD